MEVPEADPKLYKGRGWHWGRRSQFFIGNLISNIPTTLSLPLNPPSTQHNSLNDIVKYILTKKHKI